jgi:beta-N-acetylhexosaminidase
MSRLKKVPLGPVMLDIDGLDLTVDDKELLQHPAVNGMILFGRNFESAAQIDELVKSIRKTRQGLLIAVDHEGGRVQRFRPGFAKLPPNAAYGEAYQRNTDTALEAAEQHAWLIASELQMLDIDLAFAPVLDLDYGCSSVIGDRAFHSDPVTVTALAKAFLKGLHRGGMAGTGKHFPGHGGVKGDSHLELPVDSRTWEEIQATDLQPFIELAKAGLESVMPAHVVFPAIDSQPAGFSRKWISEILRQQCQFDGAAFSDDLSMQGAAETGSYADRAWASLEAGCDVALVCNNREGAIQIVEAIGSNPNKFPLLDGLESLQRRLGRLAGKRLSTYDSLSHLQQSSEYQMAQRNLNTFMEAQ